MEGGRRRRRWEQTLHGPSKTTGTLPLLSSRARWTTGHTEGPRCSLQQGGRTHKILRQKEKFPLRGSDQWLDEWYKSAPKIPEIPEDARSIPEVKQETCDRTQTLHVQSADEQHWINFLDLSGRSSGVPCTSPPSTCNVYPWQSKSATPWAMSKSA